MGILSLWAKILIFFNKYMHRLVLNFICGILSATHHKSHLNSIVFEKLSDWRFVDLHPFDSNDASGLHYA